MPIPTHRFLALALLLVLVVSVPGCGGSRIEETATGAATATLATLEEIRALLESGELTSEQLVQAHLDRIEAFDHQGPALNAMITVNPGALATARDLDAERLAKGPRGPLHGIPIILKDNYDTADMPTTGGSALLAEGKPADDAFVVARLREAGAVILGKANMSEFALSYGWLGYGSMVGHTRNPHAPLRDPSGSSSGSAAGVAAGYGVLGTGTDTAGSIRGPATVCGVVGIKPTMGLLSRDGIIPASLSLDVAGPLARSVAGAAHMLAVMAGVDPADPATRAAERRELDLEAALSPSALKGARLGVVRSFEGANGDVDTVFAENLALLEERGAQLVPVELPESLDNLWPVMGPVVDADFGPEIEAYLAERNAAAPKTVADLIARAEDPAVAESATPLNPGRVQGFRDAQAAGGYASEERRKSREELMPEVRRKLLAIMDDDELDGLVFPTMPCPASPRHDVEDASYTCDIDDPYRPCYMASTSGFPEITVPAGFTAGDVMPVGLSFLGRPFSETRLIGLALDFEQASGARRVPVHTPVLEP